MPDVADQVRPATLIIQVKVKPGKNEEFAGMQYQLHQMVQVAPGFISQAVLAPQPPVQEDWVVVDRFESRAQARDWLDSPDRARLLAAIDNLIDGERSVSIIDEAPAPIKKGSTAVILTMVEPGKETSFRKWHDDINAAQSKRPGFVGCTLQAPVEGVQPEWVTMVTFDSDAELDEWLDSDERARLLEEGEGISHDTSTRWVMSGFQGWFDYDRKDVGGQPPPWKFNYLILVGLYPIVMLEILFLNNKLDWMNLAFGNLIGNILSVAILGWPVVAILSKFMGWWIVPSPTAPKSTDLKGALVMLALLAVMVVGFYFVVKYVGFDAKVLKI